MNRPIDYAAFELGQARPRLRDDLKYTLQQSVGRPDRQYDSRWYVIEDEANGKFYRVGHSEYVFLSLLDGKTTVQAAIAQTAAELGSEAFTENEAATLCRWLVETRLAEKRRHDREHWSETQRQRKLIQRCRWVNPIMLKVPLGNPDKCANALTCFFGWLFCWPIGVGVIAFWTLAVLLLMSRVDELFNPSAPILSSSNWILLGLSWLLLRCIHETAHAVACKRYGGAVREWGILFLMFIPLPYVDVTSAWRFPLRRARVLTSAAGILAELSIAALAAVVWCNVDSEFVRQNCMNVMFAASFTTLLFNANPLMRFDGYHILADGLNVPNLWTHGRGFTKAFGRRVFFGLSTRDPACLPHQKWFVKLYGVCSFVWTGMVLISLSLAALSLFDGVGLVLAALAIAIWIGIPLFRLIHFLLRGTEFEQPNRCRFALTSSCILAGGAIVGLALPAPSVVSAPMIVKHDPLTIVRANSPGFIRAFDVVPGAHVEAGDVLCRLENVELESQLREVSIRLAASQQRVRAFISAGEPAAAQQESEVTDDLTHRRDDLERRVKNLTVVSPVAGLLLDDDYQDRVGSYLKRGDEIFSIGGCGPKLAVALVSQTDASQLSDRNNQQVELRVWGWFGGTFSGTIRRINPRAQPALPHFSFAAPAGGPLAVREIDSSGTKAVSHSEADGGVRWQLVDPRVQVDIELSERASSAIQAGQTGIAHLRARETRLASYLVANVMRNLRDRIQRTHGI